MTITIADNHISKTVVVVSSDADESVQHAAAELVFFLHQITGAKFEITHRTSSDTSRILVGPQAARLADPEFSTVGLGDEGMVIRTIGNDLILAGGNPRGTLYAVYSFLEDQLGCRWWSSKVSTIPEITTLKIEPLDIKYIPPLEYRELWWFDAFNGDWSVRNKCNGHKHQLDTTRGGGLQFEGYVHTFYKLIPPEKYFTDHPEWYSEIDGQRTFGDHTTAQLCLTNEQARLELTKTLKERLRANPQATIASVSQRDWLEQGCQCSKCQASDQEDGSPAGTLLRFVNAVAADIEKEFPRVSISTLAYTFTRTPPKITQPRHNVIVRLCTFECSFSQPLTDPINIKFHDDLVGWSKICRRLYIWDYTTNFDHYLQPHPNLRVLGPNIKFLTDHHVKGIMEQGAYQAHGAEFAELRAWVLAKLLWNPDQNGTRLIEEFVNGYYGPAGRHIQAYLKTTHDAIETSRTELGLYSPPEINFLTLKTLSESWRHITAAQHAVNDQPEFLPRVQHCRLSILYVAIRRWDELRRKALEEGIDWPWGDSAEQAREQFEQCARSLNITRLNEWEEGFGPLIYGVRKKS
ncbi:MAG: DUF4838 domain-containing protein [Planctomycetes bacterium]|nr:DUF4838 domain-containing protein [Planctomycetota bacterium]